MGKRGSGVLLHITSLPSPFGIGDMGPWAYKFADFLADAKQSYWQILPLSPTDLAHNNSPYHSTSAFAGNPILISPEMLVQDGLLDSKDLEPLNHCALDRVDYAGVHAYKLRLFDLAFRRFFSQKDPHDFEIFCADHDDWLDGFALFTALKSCYDGRSWNKWPEGWRDRDLKDLEPAKKAVHEAYEKERFLQYVFWRQWAALKDYCHNKGIRIIGDVPIYLIYESADIWTHPDIVNLDDKKKPQTIAGVPPDYFSETGQLWGNPVYRWDVLRDSGYDWWIRRIKYNLKRFDFIRIDHFRGFVAYWEVPAAEKNAVRGQWVKAPAEDFFNTLFTEIPNAPIIAEDLGTITPDVTELMDRLNMPGMKVLLFAFGDVLATNPYTPHNYIENCVAYTGTHDNNTIKGWFENEATSEDKDRLFRYIGRRVNVEEVHQELIRLAMMSVAQKVIFPMQDILGLGEKARMNRPATREGNWKWRMEESQLTSSVIQRLREMTEIYGR